MTMLTTLATVKVRLAIDEFDLTYDTILTNAINAISFRFDKETNRTLARTVNITQEFDATDTEICLACYPFESLTRFELKTTEAEGWIEQTGVSCPPGHSPLGVVGNFVFAVPQGSSVRAGLAILATLGWRTQSRWD